jgi:uncharacterized membrane protein
MDRGDAAGGRDRARRQRAVAAAPHHDPYDGRDCETGGGQYDAATWRSRAVVRPSPDLLYSICVYDLSAADGVVRVSAHDMPQSYWSVSVFDANTDNFYALNDRQAKTGAADFLLAAPGTSAAGDSRLPVIAAPTNRGIVLFRTLVNDESGIAAIDVARHNAACEPYKAR